MAYNIEDDLYDAIVFTENTGFTRTTGIPKRGSSAYGPAGLTSGTGSMIENQLNNLGAAGFPKWSEDEIKFMQRFRKQGEKLLKYGNKDWIRYIDPDTGLVDGMTQKEVVNKYEYGGVGDLSEDDKKMYKIVAKKLIKSEYNRMDQDVDKFIKKWRGNVSHYKPGGIDPGNKSYFDRFWGKYNKLTEKRKNKNDIESLMPDEAIMDSVLKGVQ